MKILIADSGGTKTDWCLINGSHKEFFTTESYHPVNWDTAFKARIKDFWVSYNCTNIKLHFFGAGCLNKEKSNILLQEFKSIGFNEVSVQSDLHAAAMASFGRKKGRIAILGTGSIFFNWNGEEVSEIIGGKGHLLGDEGSGYYFGKLLLSAYLKNELSNLQLELIQQYVPKIDKVRIEDKFTVASFAGLLKNHKSEFRSFHRKNFKLFIEKHLSSSIKSFSIVGSYGVNHAQFLQEELALIGCKLIQKTERPILKLVEQSAFLIE